MDQGKINEILEMHEKWLVDVPGGKRADLCDADLRGADLRGADLCDANLCDADLDFSCLPLWCGGLGVHIDDRLAVQILYHLLFNVQYSKNISDEIKKALLTFENIELANRFHRVKSEDVKPLKLEEEK